MSVFLVLLLTLWIGGSKVALLHLHVGKLLLGQSQPPIYARKFQIPVEGFRDGMRRGRETQKTNCAHPCIQLHLEQLQ